MRNEKVETPISKALDTQRDKCEFPISLAVDKSYQ